VKHNETFVIRPWTGRSDCSLDASGMYVGVCLCVCAWVWLYVGV